MKNLFIALGILLVIACIGILIFVFPLRTIPDGVPNDYFDRIDIIEENDLEIYVYSDDIDFNNDLKIFKIFDINELSKSKNYQRVIVIDMNKYNNDSFATEEELLSYYQDYKTTIIFVNYHKSHSNLLNDFLQQDFLESDLIIYGYEKNHTAIQGTVSSEFPNNQALMYAIIHQLSHLYN